MSDWSVTLNGVTLGCDDPEALGTLSFPPDGLGLPEMRTEDVTYPQRDGVRHFSDWYGPRIITLEEVTVCSDGCENCLTARARVQQITRAWSRQCEDIELVIHTDCEPDTRINYSIDPRVQRPGAVTTVVTNLHHNPFLTNGYGLTSEFRAGTLQPGLAGGGPIVSGTERSYMTFTPTDSSTADLRLWLNSGGAPSISVEPGQDLHFSVMARTDSVGETVSVSPRIEWRDAFDASFSTDTGTETLVESDWETIEFDIIVPDGAAGAKLQLDVSDLVMPEAFHVSGALVTVDGYTGEVFDGNSPDAAGIDFVWNGGMYNSSSAALAVPPLEWPEGVMLTSQGGQIVGDVGNPDVEAPDGTPWTAYLLGGGTVSGEICGTPPEWPSTGVIVQLMVGDGPYFDGSFPDTDDIRYEWSGTPWESISLESAVVDRAITGPFGVIGRPRVATHSWVRGVDCATMLLRFDGVDHRMYVLDGSGQPGSGTVQVQIDPATEALARCYPRCYTSGGEPGVPDTLLRTNLHPNPFVGSEAADVWSDTFDADVSGWSGYGLTPTGTWAEPGVLRMGSSSNVINWTVTNGDYVPGGQFTVTARMRVVSNDAGDAEGPHVSFNFGGTTVTANVDGWSFGIGEWGEFTATGTVPTSFNPGTQTGNLRLGMRFSGSGDSVVEIDSVTVNSAAATGWTLGGRGGVTQTVEADSGPTIDGRTVPWRGLSFSEGTGAPTVYTNGDGTPQFSLTGGETIAVSAYVLSPGVGTQLGLQTDAGTVWGTGFNPGEGWTQLSSVLTVPETATQGRLLVQFAEADLQPGVLIGVTGALVGADGEPFDGDTADTDRLRYDWTGQPYQSSSQEWLVGTSATGDTYCYDTETGTGVGPTPVDNIGTECAYPVICFHGTLTDPVLENVTTGETVGIRGFIAAGLDPICVDTENLTAEQGGASRTHLITGNAGFTLNPGTNNLRLTSYSTSDSGYVTVEFRPSVVSA